eukprot:3470651-Pyramimonas_sp.AAC.1
MGKALHRAAVQCQARDLLHTIDVITQNLAGGNHARGLLKIFRSSTNPGAEGNLHPYVVQNHLHPGDGTQHGALVHVPQMPDAEHLSVHLR